MSQLHRSKGLNDLLESSSHLLIKIVKLKSSLKARKSKLKKGH